MGLRDVASQPTEGESMREISLSRGYVALVDDEDYEWLSQTGWTAKGRITDPTIYAAHSRRDENGVRRHVWMHRRILGLERGSPLQVDHINGNGLDNRRANLRVCTLAENHRNRRKLRPTSSRYKGVSFHTFGHKWQSAIRCGDKNIHLGCFTDEETAALAYNVAATQLYGPYARLNEVPIQLEHRL